MSDTMKALRDLVMVCGSTGDPLTDFEEQAAAFQRETGFMRPGKDAPAAFGSTIMDDRDVRRLKYEAWVQTKIEAARDLVRSAGHVSESAAQVSQVNGG